MYSEGWVQVFLPTKTLFAMDYHGCSKVTPITEISDFKAMTFLSQNWFDENVIKEVIYPILILSLLLFKSSKY